VAPAALVAILVMAVLAVGTVSIGRLAAVRSDAQQAADSAALAACQIIRDRGMPFNAQARTAAQNIAARNSQLPVGFTWTVNETPTSVDVTVQSTINVDLPSLIFAGGTRSVQAQASGRVTQSRYDEAERRIPKLAMVLDYSGSMQLQFSYGGGGPAIDILEDSIEALLNEDLMIDYGAVFYSDDVIHSVPISAAAPGQIISWMHSHGTYNMTNTSAGIRRARQLLTATDNTGYYILLVSDGEPNNGGGMSGARAQANAAWNNDISIITLEIRRAGSSVAMSNFMTSVSGTPSSRGDPNYHYVAMTASDLIDTFRDIVASIICKVGPLNPVPADLSTVHVFLSAGATERVVPAIPAGDSLADWSADERYQYFAGDNTIRLTDAACDAVIDSGDEIVIRFDRPFLTD